METRPTPALLGPVLCAVALAVAAFAQPSTAFDLIPPVPGAEAPAPRSREAVIARSRELAAAGRTQEAKRVLEERLADRSGLGTLDGILLWVELGDRFSELGNPRAAAESLRVATTLAVAWIEAEPTNEVPLRIAAGLVSSLAGFQEAAGDLEAALTTRRKGIVFAEMLAAGLPEDRELQMNLAFEYTVIADLHRRRNERARQLDFLEKAAARHRAIEASWPGDEENRRVLADVRASIVRCHEALGGNPAAAD